MNPRSADAALTVFVFFRSTPEDRERTHRALRGQLAAVRAATGVDGRAGLRLDADKPYLTWLEVYEPVPAERLRAVLDAIDTGAGVSGLAALALEGRHAEVFECPPGPLAEGVPAAGSTGLPPCA